MQPEKPSSLGTSFTSLFKTSLHQKESLELVALLPLANTLNFSSRYLNNKKSLQIALSSVRILHFPFLFGFTNRLPMHKSFIRLATPKEISKNTSYLVYN